jgi:hypothetical protein
MTEDEEEDEGEDEGEDDDVLCRYSSPHRLKRTAMNSSVRTLLHFERGYLRRNGNPS